MICMSLVFINIVNYILKMMHSLRRLTHIVKRRFAQVDELDNIKSLFYSYRNVTDVNREQRQLHNMKLLTPNVEKKIGHVTDLNEEQKIRIDTLANGRLSELEESNMTREELLELPGKGIKLAADPFFQLIKNDLKARHRLLSKANVDYSVDNIVKFALNQEIEFDRAASGTGRRIKTQEDEYNQDRDGILAESHQFKLAEAEDYYRGVSEPRANEYKQKADIDVLKPIKTVRREKTTVINPLDIHWRNTELLVRFMTRFSTIKHRKYTGLPTSLQKKITRTIKHSRQMNLLSHNSYMKPHYSKPLRTLAEDIEDDKFYEIDVETGTMHRENISEARNYHKEHFKVQLNHLDKEEIIKGKESKEVELLREAKEYLRQIKLKNSNRNELSKSLQPEMVISYIETKFKPLSEEKLAELKKSYEEFKSLYSDISVNDITELLVAEVNEDLDTLKYYKEFTKLAREGEVQESYQELLEQLTALKEKINYKDEAYLNNKAELNIINNLKVETKE